MGAMPPMPLRAIPAVVVLPACQGHRFDGWSSGRPTLATRTDEPLCIAIGLRSAEAREVVLDGQFTASRPELARAKGCTVVRQQPLCSDARADVVGIRVAQEQDRPRFVVVWVHGGQRQLHGPRTASPSVLHRPSGAGFSVARCLMRPSFLVSMCSGSPGLGARSAQPLRQAPSRSAWTSPRVPVRG